MTATDLFPGFTERTVPGRGGTIHLRIGGMGPPLLLLHGYPESHAMWHRVAPALAEAFTVVVVDLPGYGRSYLPPVAPTHEPHSKRAMATDMCAVMTALGFERFRLMGHDRGARVAYRLALDHPDRVHAVMLLDIITTADLWDTINRARMMRMYHWAFLAQPAPLPEHMISGDPKSYLEGRFKRGAAMLPGWLEPAVLADYWRAFGDPAYVAASCEDYRAGATCDVDHDLADRAAGRRIAAPVLVQWGRRGNLADTPDPLALWRPWCRAVEGHAVESGHFIPEENPAAVLAAAVPFFGR